MWPGSRDPPGRPDCQWVPIISASDSLLVFYHKYERNSNDSFVCGGREKHSLPKFVDPLPAIQLKSKKTKWRQRWANREQKHPVPPAPIQCNVPQPEKVNNTVYIHAYYAVCKQSRGQGLIVGENECLTIQRHLRHLHRNHPHVIVLCDNVTHCLIDRLTLPCFRTSCFYFSNLWTFSHNFVVKIKALQVLPWVFELVKLNCNECCPLWAVSNLV